MDALLSMVGLSDGCMNNEYENAQKNIVDEAADQGSSNEYESTGSNKSRDEFDGTITAEADEAPSDVIASLSTLINDAHTSSTYGGHTVEPWRQRHPLRRYQEPTLSKMIWPCDCNSEMKIIRERAARVEENMDNLFTQITQIFQHINPPETSRVPSLQSRFLRDPSSNLQVPLSRLGSSLDVKVCNSCRKVFANEGALMAHRDVCKESNLPTSTEKQSYNPYAKVEFTCFCGVVFYTEANYKVHSSFCDTFRTHKLELKEHNKGNGLCEFCGTIVFGGPTVMRVHWSRCRDKKAKEKLHVAPATVTLSSSDEEKEKEEIVLDSDSDASIVEVTSKRCDTKLGESSSATIRDDLARIRREFLQTNKERSSTSSDPDNAFRPIDSREASVDGDQETVEIEGQEAAPSSSHPHLECERDWNGERESGDQDEESDCWTRTLSDVHERNKEGKEENSTGDDDDDDTLCADLEQIQKERLERAMRKLDDTFSQFNSNLVAKGGMVNDPTTRRTRSSLNVKTGSLLQRLKGKRKSNDISSQQNREKLGDDEDEAGSPAAPVLSPEVDDDLPPVLSDEEPCRDQIAEVDDSDCKAKTDSKRARISAPVEVTSSTLDLDSIPDGDPRIDDATFVLMHPTEDRLLSAEETVNFLCRDILKKIRLVSNYVSRALIRLKGMSWMQLCEDSMIDSALLQLRISGYTKKEDDRDIFRLGIGGIL